MGDNNRLHIPFKDWSGRELDDARGQRKFISDVANDMRTIERWARRGGGKPYATIVIAASDSVAEDAANADYVCTGSADDVKINSALQDLNDGGVGGSILLLEGTYNLSATILLTTPSTDHVVLEGQGPGTTLEFPGGTCITAQLGAEYATVKNMRFTNCASAINMQASGSTIEHVWVDDGGGAVTSDAILTTSMAFTLIHGAHIRDCNGYAIRLNSGGSDGNIISGCTFFECGSNGALAFGSRGAIRLDGAAESVAIVGNNFHSSAQHSVYVANAIECVITGNTFNGVTNPLARAYIAEIEIAGGGDCVVVGNQFHVGAVNDRAVYITSAGSVTNLVAANQFDALAVGVYLDAADCTIQGNLFAECTTGVLLTASATRALVDGNTFRLNTTAINDSSTTNSFGAGNFIDGVWTLGTTSTAVNPYGGTATKFVAASNATDAEKARADYTCDGTGDESEINSAITALPANGGTVYLSTGTFNLNSGSTPITLNKKVELIGQGRNESTKITKTSTNTATSAISVTAADCVIRDLEVLCSTGDAHAVTASAAANYLTITNCGLAGRGAAKAAVNAAYFTSIEDSELSGLSSANGVIATQDFLTVRRCYLTAPADVIVLDNKNYCIVDGCTTDGAISAGFVRCSTQGRFNVIVNNIISIIADLAIDAVFGYSIIANNVFEDITGATAIKLTSSLYTTVSNNIISYPGHHGIWLLDCNDVAVLGNMIVGAGQTTNDTYSGILLDGDTNDCNVQNNTVRHDAATNKAKYGVRIDDATCDNNFVTNNDVKDGYVTAGISDAGTGTITAAGNRS